jgi:signal transduction histidine kinase
MRMTDRSGDRYGDSMTMWPLRAPRRHTVAVDVCIALSVAAMEITSAALVARESGEPRLTVVAVALLLAETLPLVWVRRRPELVLAVSAIAACVFGIRNYPDPFLHLGALLALYALACLCPRRTTVIAGALTLLVAFAATALAGDADAVGFYLVGVTVALAWLLGWNQQTRVQELETERDFHAERVVAEERQRVARELHDIVAHRVSMMIVQSEAGGSVASGAGDDVAERFDAIAASGREALTELRRLLGVLRNQDDADQLAPQPSIDRLDSLVDEMAGAGLSVVLSVEGRVRSLPPGVELSGYRIVQEALTNSLRHAGPANVTVRLRYSDDALDLEIADDGPGRRGTSVGWGLVGIRERVAMFGGSLTVGERPGGGFLVGATLPLDAR